MLLHDAKLYAIAYTCKTPIADVHDVDANGKFPAMSGWRERLERTIAERGETMRSASLKAKLGHNYVHGILKEDKDATVDRLLAICQALEVSPAFILLGQDAPPQVEELLLLMQASPERREAILALLRS